MHWTYRLANAASVASAHRCRQLKTNKQQLKNDK